MLNNALGPELPLLLLRRRPPGRPRISQLRRRSPVGAGGRQDGAGSDGSDGSDGHAPAQQHETQYKAQNKAMV